MGSKSADLRAAGFEVIFAYEEAIGFCCGDIVPLVTAGWELVGSERRGGTFLMLRGLTLGPDGIPNWPQFTSSGVPTYV